MYVLQFTKPADSAAATTAWLSLLAQAASEPASPNMRLNHDGGLFWRILEDTYSLQGSKPAANKATEGGSTSKPIVSSREGCLVRLTLRLAPAEQSSVRQPLSCRHMHDCMYLSSSSSSSSSS
jgi:hypothetical protein